MNAPTVTASDFTRKREHGMTQADMADMGMEPFRVEFHVGPCNAESAAPILAKLDAYGIDVTCIGTERLHATCYAYNAGDAHFRVVEALGWNPLTFRATR